MGDSGDGGKRAQVFSAAESRGHGKIKQVRPPKRYPIPFTRYANAASLVRKPVNSCRGFSSSAPPSRDSGKHDRTPRIRPRARSLIYGEIMKPAIGAPPSVHTFPFRVPRKVQGGCGQVTRVDGNIGVRHQSVVSSRQLKFLPHRRIILNRNP